MSKIVFEFRGGLMDGRKLEGGENRSLSTVHRDPVLHHWLTTRCGTPGERFYLQPDKASPMKELYEVSLRTLGDDVVVVQADFIS